MSSAINENKTLVRCFFGAGPRARVQRRHGTHQGQFLGRPARGNKIDAMAFQLYRIEDDQLAERWEVADFAPLIRQLDT